VATMGNIHIGISGWRYKPWRGSFYPEDLPQRLELDFASRKLNSIEINGTFYSLQRPPSFAKWSASTPKDFVFSVKGARFITHMKKLKDCQEALDTFIDLARRLKSYLGPILYQLPPSLHKDVPRLDAFLKLLPRSLEHVFEFRHRSWYDEDVLALLDRHGAGFVTHDLVGLKSPRWASGRTAYVRFHGTAGKYRGRYSDAQMGNWADWLLEQRGQGRSAWAYFNNDIGGDAIEDARNLKTRLA
jgi:uncharacterized protein YecE (DUF72 family)